MTNLNYQGQLIEYPDFLFGDSDFHSATKVGQFIRINADQCSALITLDIFEINEHTVNNK